MQNIKKKKKTKYFFANTLCAKTCVAGEDCRKSGSVSNFLTSILITLGLPINVSATTTSSSSSSTLSFDPRYDVPRPNFRKIFV